MLRKSKQIAVPNDLKAKLFGYSFAKVDMGVEAVNYFQIAVAFSSKEVQRTIIVINSKGRK